MAIYQIPFADSVPKELWEYLFNPVFMAEDLTLDMIQARAYQADDKGDTPGWRIDICVLYGEVAVSVNTKGATPEQVWELFSKLPR